MLALLLKLICLTTTCTGVCCQGYIIYKLCIEGFFDNLRYKYIDVTRIWLCYTSSRFTILFKLFNEITAIYAKSFIVLQGGDTSRHIPICTRIILFQGCGGEGRELREHFLIYMESLFRGKSFFKVFIKFLMLHIKYKMFKEAINVDCKELEKGLSDSNMELHKLWKGDKTQFFFFIKFMKDKAQ